MNKRSFLLKKLAAKTGKYGRHSIATRWMVNTLLVVSILLIVANVCVYYFTRQYYYGSA